ncbi:hypothetical protein D3C72_1492670 [compost metagenome]
MYAAAAAADLARRLQAAQHQDRQDGQLVLFQRPLDAHAVFILGDPRAGLRDAVDELALHQALQHVVDGFFGQGHDGVAAGQLVAAVRQRVERQRIAVRRQRFLFRQHGQHADLEGVEQIRIVAALFCCVFSYVCVCSHACILNQPACSFARNRIYHTRARPGSRCPPPSGWRGWFRCAVPAPRRA